MAVKAARRKETPRGSRGDDEHEVAKAGGVTRLRTRETNTSIAGRGREEARLGLGGTSPAEVGNTGNYDNRRRRAQEDSSTSRHSFVLRNCTSN